MKGPLQREPTKLASRQLKSNRSLCRQRHKQATLLLGLLIGVVLAVHLRFYLASPSGRFPLLDGAENIALAQRIAQGTLPAEPFFRAMLYPGLLALFLKAGALTDWLPMLAAVLGVCLHAGSTMFIYWIARRAWASARAGLWAAGLFGLNPVAIYFATEPLDTTLGLFLFLGGLKILHNSFTGPSPGRLGTRFHPAPVAIGTFFWVLAMLARPHYAINLAALPVWFILLLRSCPRRLIAALAIFGLVSATWLGITGVVQKRIGGQFRIMPTQGAFSLWAGNRPGANGRYYVQQIHLAAGTAAEGENPARVESELLYQRATGEKPPFDMVRMNHYWRATTRAAVREHPLDWLGLMGRKVYYLFNNFEQYNNKTFAVQKDLFPALRFNPLGWGVTLILCVGGLVLAALLRRRCAGFLFLLTTAGAYGGGAVLFFVSDRFRLPLLPFLCVGAGFWGTLSRKQLLKLHTRKAAACLLAVLAAGLVAFSRGWGVYDLSPAVQDYVLLSIANRKAGDDMESLRWARRALAERSDHPDALACAATAFYNLKLQGLAPEREFADESWETQRQRIARIPEPANSVRLVLAVADWKTSRPDQARALLERLVQAGTTSQEVADDALGVLLLAKLSSPEQETLALSRASNTASLYLMTALRRRETATRLLLPPARRETVTQTEAFVRNLFP